MSQPKDLKLARLPPRLDTFTDIQAPSVKRERINGKDKYSLTPGRAGVITIFSDGENERPPSSRPRAVKRERSRVPPRAIEQSRQSTQPRIKQEPSVDRHGPPRSYRQTIPAAPASDTRRTHGHEPLRRRQPQGTSVPANDSSSSSDSSGSDGSDSSESEGESDSSSGSSSSEDSSSEDDANASVYRPTTPASSIGSSPPKTRGNKETGVRRASANLVAASPSRRSVQNEPSIGSRHAPLDFFIDLPAGPLRGPSDVPGRSKSHSSPNVERTGAQANRTAHSSHHRPSKSSPVVLGFMPINRASAPPQNAPTEPRAMRVGQASPAGTPMSSTQRPGESMSRSVPGPSTLPLRGSRVGKDKPQQNGEQRRGPARPGRTMQTIEQLPVESPSTSSLPKNALSRRDSRAATPGPNTRQTAPPPASPGIFVTPRALSVRPNPVVRTHDSPQSVSRPQGKRTFEETGDADSASKAVEWERMLARIKNHEREMEEQRAQLEATKRLLSEQKSRIDDLERRRRGDELIRDAAAQTIEEPDVDPLPSVAHRDAPAAPVPCRQAERRGEERRRQDTCQSERGDKRKRRISSRVAPVQAQEQERERIEQERQEDLELEQQLEQEQRRQAERIQCAARGLQNNALQNHVRTGPAQRILDAVQRRIQHDVFNQPLSGHNPKIIFDDDDRPHISEATAFLMRLPQSFVLARLRRLIEGKDFFETAHLGSTHLGCWVVSRRAACDLRMKLTDSGETHSFSFARLAVRLWHDEQSIYSLLQHQSAQLKAGHTCHVDACMRPEHIVIETDRAAGERRKCKARGRCYGHRTIHKDGTREVRKLCIFSPRGQFAR